MRYLGLLLISMFVPLFFVGGLLYYLMFTVMADQIGIPEYIAINLFPVINKINLMLMIGVPPVLFVLLLWGIAVSHRFAGPLERLEGELKKISGTRDFNRRLKLRKYDDIRPIADAVNEVLDVMAERQR